MGGYDSVVAGIHARLEWFQSTLRSPDAGRVGLQDSSAWFLESPQGAGAAEVLSQIEALASTVGCLTIAGSWRDGLIRPFGGFLEAIDVLAERMLSEDPDLLRRAQVTVVNLLPCWHERLLTLDGSTATPLKPRLGLQDFVLRGNRKVLHHFFQKRNVAPRGIANLVHLVLDSAAVIAQATEAPLLLCLEGIDCADRMTLQTLQLLSRYAQAAATPLVLCASGRTLSEQARRDLTGKPGRSPAWREVTSEAHSAVAGAAVTSTDAEDDPQWAAVSRASVLASPFSLFEWCDLLGEFRGQLPELAEALVGKRLIRRCGTDRFAFYREHVRRAIESGLDPDLRRRLHRAALDGEQGRDPFLAAYHAAATSDESRIHETSLAAMEWAWADSAYECAITYAERAVASAGPDRTFDPNLLMAMLCYEAERYQDADRHFRAALKVGDARPDGVERTMLEYFLAYNTVFGLGDFDRGQAQLISVLAQYEAQGESKCREAGYVRNSLAFAMYRDGKLDEAIALEGLLIDTMRSGRVDTFLLSIVNLNLGRLYRNIGVADRAVELFKAGMFSPTSELSPYAQLLFYASLGHVYTARGEHASALLTYYHFFDLMRDLQLDGIRDQVLQSLPYKVPRLPMDLSTRGDQTHYYLYSSVAVTCQSLGLSDRVQAYLAAVERLRQVLGDDAVEATRNLVAQAQPGKATGLARAEGEFESDACTLRLQFPGIVHELARGDQVVPKTVQALAEGKAVALVRPCSWGVGVHVVDSLVLSDPRNAAVAERINLETGGGFLRRASAALVLPSARSLFRDPPELLPLIQQAASVRPEHRPLLCGLEPIRIAVQVVFPEFDNFLFELLASFERESGVGVLAATPFHLRLQSMAVDPAKALTSYLTSSIEYLVLGERLLAKTHGASAAENLLPLRPRRSRRAVIGGDRGDGFVVRINSTWGGGYTPSEFLKLHSKTRSILDLCDGRLTVAEICQRLNGEPGSARLEGKVTSFLRNLWLHGVVYFLHEDVPQQQVT